MKQRVEIAGVPFDPVTYDEALGRIDDMLKVGSKTYIVTPNPEMVLSAIRDSDFKAVLNDAGLSIPDGIGILWASYYLSLPAPQGFFGKWVQLLSSLASVFFAPQKIRQILPQRVTGTDLMYKIINDSQQYGWKVYLLGAREGVAQKAITILRALYPRANFVGCFAGSPQTADEGAIRDMVNASAPDILFVAYGSPAQEKWIHRNLPHLPSVKIAAGVGGAFDFAAGIVKRAPYAMQQLGLEWLYRLIQEPSRIGRIWNATFVFTRLAWKVKFSLLK